MPLSGWCWLTEICVFSLLVDEFGWRRGKFEFESSESIFAKGFIWTFGPEITGGIAAGLSDLELLKLLELFEFI